VGEGPERKKLETLAAKMALGSTVRFLGEQPNGWKFLAAADVVVMTTAYEGLGNVVAEAMAAGVPVLASDADGPRDILADGQQGFLVPPGDVAGLAARLGDLVASRELRVAMGKRGLEKAKEFDGNHVLRQYWKVIQDLVADPPA
jgi:glycosyltransferase involved in cell wall biosynthesis